MSDWPVQTHNCILVAEDLEANQELARIYLHVGGYQAEFVANGAAAVKAVQSKIYDLVLMDVQMPQMDGIAATKAMRSLDGSIRNVPIVAMTANVLPEQIRRIEAAGMNGHVAKPMELDEFLREIRRLVGPAKVLDNWVEGAPAERGALVVKDFREFRAISGNEIVTAWLTRLLKELQVTFFDRKPNMYDRSKLAHRVHAIVSQAGILGFSDLSRLCSALEEACANGGNVLPAFEKAALAASAARLAIGSLGDQAIMHHS
jgi:CheY-like chemotaxis protein